MKNIMIVFLLSLSVIGCENKKHNTNFNQNRKKANISYPVIDTIEKIINERNFEMCYLSDSIFNIKFYTDSQINCRRNYIQSFKESGEAFLYKLNFYTQDFKNYTFCEFPLNYVQFVKTPFDNEQRQRKNIIIRVLWKNGVDACASYIYWINKYKTFGKKTVINQNKSLWGINYRTDTVFSNLPLKIIKQMYPDFQGYYEKRNIDSITFITKDIYNIEKLFSKMKFYVPFKYKYMFEKLN